MPRSADGLKYAALAVDSILKVADFHRKADCLRQDIVNWMVATYDKGVADGRALAEAGK